MRDFDFIFSLGNACACSQALRRLGMQFATYPFDWVVGSTLTRRADLLVNGFKGWIDEDSLELTDVMTGALNRRIYRNRQTGITFVHDFPICGSLRENLPEVSVRYARRIDRLNAILSKPGRVLAVYMELPFRSPESDDELVRVQRTIQMRFPAVEFHLLYFGQDDTAVESCERTISRNVIRVSLDCHSCGGYGHEHEIDLKPVMEYLGSHVHTDDGRTAEEKLAYAAAKASQNRKKWGHGLHAFINKRMYRIYRNLERILIRRGVLPPTQRPLDL